MMKTRLKNREYLRKYVLGTHTSERQEELEGRLLTDEKLQAELSIVEHEVLYDYVSGALSEPERVEFERGFLATPAGRRDLQFFRALKNHAESSSPAEAALLPRSWKSILPALLRGDNFFLRISIATASLILVFVGVFAVFLNWQSQRGNVFTATLGPGTTRFIGGREITLVEVPPDIGEVVLQLPVSDENAQGYTATLFTDEGEEKLTRENLRVESIRSAKVIALRISSSVLTPGDYRVKVKARVFGSTVEDIASYSFRVVNR
jgi:hypothetical protein